MKETKKTTEKTTVDQTQTTEEVTQTPATLSIQDLSLVIQIIDLAFTRGAFRGSEATDVGNVYQKISTFVNYTIESQKENEENK